MTMHIAAFFSPAAALPTAGPAATFVTGAATEAAAALAATGADAPCAMAVSEKPTVLRKDISTIDERMGFFMGSSGALARVSDIGQRHQMRSNRTL